MLGLPVTHLIAAAGAVVAIPVTWSWKLQTGADVDLTPSMHWPAPIPSRDIQANRGPVLVTVEYRIRVEDRASFLQAIAKLADERRRDGAFDWGVFEDIAQEGRFVETFLLPSWIEHLRQHERVTQADRQLQELVNRFQIGGAPQVTHLIAADFDEETSAQEH
jgi:Transmembrane secretion effector